MGLLSDESLARRAAQGDQRAFEAIYRRYHQQLYRFCLAMLGNAQDAQDTLQNTMVKVLRGLPGEKREIRLKPWLYRIARNEAVETLRRRRDSVELKPERAGGGEVAETVEARERLRVLLADLDHLPERQRAALVMRELSGLDFAQIGAAFGSSAAVARQTLYEARLSLRQLEEGREMRCADVMRELSDGDGRVVRRREIRAHLRGCAGCRAFRDEIGARRDDLAAISTLPLTAAAGILHGLLGGGSGAGGAGGMAGTIGAAGGKAVGGSAIVKSVATVAVVATVGVSAGDRSGLIELPLPGRGGDDSSQSAPAEEERAAPGASGAPAGADARNGSAPAARGGSTAALGSRDPANPQKKGGATDHAGSSGPQAQSSPGASAAAGEAGGGSLNGENPPGGGHGSSAAANKGRPDRLPEASSHGQQTAGARKPPHAGTDRGPGASTKDRGKPATAPPPSKPASPPKTPAAPAAQPPPAPPDQPPVKGKDGSASGSDSVQTPPTP